MSGITDRGPIDKAVLVTSMTEAKATYGDRQSYSVLMDTLETFFREGGSKAYIARVIGPANVTALRNLVDGAAAVSLIVKAKNPGAWGNNLTIQVLDNTDDATIQAGRYRLRVVESGVVKETSGDLQTQADAVAWAQNSVNVNVAIGASANPPVKAAAAALTTGADDRASIVDAHWLIAQNLFTKDLGPGQIAQPGRTTDNAHDQLLAHGVLNNRVPCLDLPDSGSAATLRTSALAQRNRADKGQRFGGAFAPWDVIPGLLPGTTRVVPPCGRQMGVIARNDAAGESPNVPAAGELGQAEFVIDLSQPKFSDADRESLNEAGVNVSIVKYGGVRTYGWRTLTDPLNDPNWITLSNSRLYMAIAAEADVISERHAFKMLDGKKVEMNRYGADLTGMLLPFFNEGSLYGESPAEAFDVNVGAQVNTPATIAARELHAVLELRMSPFGERVILEVVKVPSQEAIA